MKIDWNFERPLPPPIDPITGKPSRRERIQHAADWFQAVCFSLPGALVLVVLGTIAYAAVGAAMYYPFWGLILKLHGTALYAMLGVGAVHGAVAFWMSDD